MHKVDFFLRLKPCVEAVALFDAKNKYLGLMSRIKIENEVLFNGSVPFEPVPVSTTSFPTENESQESQELTAILLGSGGKTNYHFNNLFSIPFDDRTQQAWLKQHPGTVKNTIIVHTPKGFGAVLVKFHKHMQEFWKLPDSLYLYKVPVEKIKFSDDIDLSEQKYAEMGISLTDDNFIASVEISVPSDAVLRSLDLSAVIQEPIAVKCYGSSMKLRLRVKQNGDTEIISNQ